MCRESYIFLRCGVALIINALFLIFFPSMSFAVEVGNTLASFIYQGRLTDSLERGITTASVTFTVDVIAPNNSQCVLYEEVFTKDLSQSDGFFTLQIGTGAAVSSSLSLQDTFANTLSAKTGLGGCSYLPLTGDPRYLKIKVQEQNLSEVTFDNQTIVPSPYATVAQTLKGLAETDFVRINSSVSNMQSHIETLTGNDYSALTTLAEGSTYSALTTLAGGTSNLYLKPGAVVFSNSAPSSPSSGQMWYDSTNKNIKYYDGTSTKELVTTSNTVNGSINMALTGQGAAQYKITNLANPTANNDAANKLYVDTTVSSSVTAGVAAANATTIQTKTVASALSTLAAGDSGKVLKWNGTQWTADIPIAGLTAPGASQNGKSVIWNNSAGTWDYFVPGVAGAGLQFLNNQTGNTQSLVAEIASVTTPTVYSTGDVHTFRYPMASAAGVTAGLLSKADYDTFNGKQSAITSSSTLTTGSVTSSLQGGMVLAPFNTSVGNTGEVRFEELAANGTNYVGFKAPDALAADKIWTLPASDGTSGQLLKTDGAGNLSWVTDANSGGTVISITTGTGLSGGTITGSGTISLANTAVSAGSYTRANITVDAQGRLTSAAHSSAIDLNSSEVTNTLPVSKGGTGLTTGTSGGIPYFSSTSAISSSAALTSNGVMLGGGAGAAPTTTAAGTANQILRIPSGGGAPSFGSIDLSSNSVVGSTILPVVNGGTGVASLGSGNLLVGAGTGNVTSLAAGSSGNLVYATGATTWSSGTPDLVGLVDKSSIQTISGAKAFTNSLNMPGNSIWNSSGNVGIGTTNPSQRLEIFGNIAMRDNSGAYNSTWSTAPGMINFGSASNHNLAFLVNNNERMRIDTTGNVGIGTTSLISKLNIVDIASSQLTLNQYSTNNSPTRIIFRKSRGTEASPTTVANGDLMGDIIFQGTPDGTNFKLGATIGAVVDTGTISGSSMPGYLYFGTTPINAVVPTERMRISENGNIGIGTTDPVAKLTLVKTPYNYTVSNSTYDTAVDIRTDQSGSYRIGQRMRMEEPDGTGGMSLELLTKENTWAGGGANLIRGYTDFGNKGTFTKVFQVDFGGTAFFNGNVGIGTATTQMKLQINGTGGFDTQGSHETVWKNNVYYSGGDRWIQGGSAKATQIVLDDSGLSFYGSPDASTGAGNVITNWTKRFVIDPSGNVGIGTVSPSYKLDVQGGGVNTSGSYTNVSDVRLKENIYPLENSLEKILQLQGVSYYWKDPSFDATKQVGFIAQEVEKVYPELVKTDSRGFKAMSYTQLVAPVVSALQGFYIKWIDDSNVIHSELASMKTSTDLANARASKLEAENATLKAKADKLEADNSAIKAEAALVKSYLCSKDPSALICK